MAELHAPKLTKLEIASRISEIHCTYHHSKFVEELESLSLDIATAVHVLEKDNLKRNFINY